MVVPEVKFGEYDEIKNTMKFEKIFKKQGPTRI